MLSCSPLVNKTILLNTVFVLVVLIPVPDPDLEIRGMAGRGGGGREAVIQTLRLEGGPQSPNFFSSLRASYCSKIKGGGTGWIRY